MSVYHGVINVSTPRELSFFDLTEEVEKEVIKSNITNGILVVFSQHTSCCVLIQEDSEAETYNHIPLILEDTIQCLTRIIPDCKYEGQYLHPGKTHIKNAFNLRQEDPAWCLNTDAHIRSCLLGRSESIPLIDGKLLLGEFGRIYFGDLDSTRARERKVHVQIVGD